MDGSKSSTKRDIDRGRWLILSAACLWSPAGVFIKFLDLHPLTIVFYRSLFASLVFAPFLRRNRFQFNLPILVSVLSYAAATLAGGAMILLGLGARYLWPKFDKSAEAAHTESRK